MLIKYLRYDLTTLTIMLLSISFFAFLSYGLMYIVCFLGTALFVALFVLCGSLVDRMIYQYNLLLAVILPISVIVALFYIANYLFKIESFNKSENMIFFMMLCISIWSIFLNLFVITSHGKRDCLNDLANKISEFDGVPYEYCTTDVHDRFIFVKYHLTFEINHVVWCEMGYRIDIVQKYMLENNLTWQDLKDEDFQLIEMLII